MPITNGLGARYLSAWGAATRRLQNDAENYALTSGLRGRGFRGRRSVIAGLYSRAAFQVQLQPPHNQAQIAAELLEPRPAGRLLHDTELDGH